MDRACKSRASHAWHTACSASRGTAHRADYRLAGTQRKCRTGEMMGDTLGNSRSTGDPRLTGHGASLATCAIHRGSRAPGTPPRRFCHPPTRTASCPVSAYIPTNRKRSSAPLLMNHIWISGASPRRICESLTRLSCHSVAHNLACTSLKSLIHVMPTRHSPVLNLLAAHHDKRAFCSGTAERPDGTVCDVLTADDTPAHGQAQGDIDFSP